MKRITPVLILLALTFFSSSLFAQCVGTAAIDLDGNNIKARLNTNGSFWFDGANAGYEVPSGSGIHSLFAGSIWMGGTDPGGNIKLAAQTYGTGNGDEEYSPGPLNEMGETDETTCSNWDRFFEVQRMEVAAHRADWEDNMTIDNPIPANIMGWPATGNDDFESIHGFDLPPINDFRGAPFVDVNQNGQYDPGQGDYPKIKGDQNIFWIYNDNGRIHSQTNGDPIRMQLNCMAYSNSSANDLVNNTTLYDITAYHRGLETISDFAMGIWLDPDLGCFADDFIGSIPEHDIAYVHNGDDLDEDCSGLMGYQENIPVLSVKILKTRFFNGEDGLSSYMYYFNSNVAPSQGMSDPVTAPEFLNYLRGSWRDGLPLSQGGTGYAPGAPAYNYAFDGSTVNGEVWKECEIGNTPGDRRMLMNMDLNELFPGAISRFTFAVMWKPQKAIGCPDTDAIITDGDMIAELDSLMDEASDGSYAGPIALFGNTVFASNTVEFTDASYFGPVEWEWDFGNGATSTDQNPTYQYNSPGIYTVCLTVTNSAGAQDTYCEDLDIMLLMPPMANYSFDNYVDIGQVVFTDLSTNMPTSWLWDFADGNTSDEQNPTHIFTADGTYEVCLTASNDDGSDTSCQSIVISLLDLNELNAENKVKLLPNPAQNKTQILFENVPSSQVTLRMYNSVGKRIELNTLNLDAGIELDIHALTSGIYFIELRNAQGELFGGERLVKL